MGYKNKPLPFGSESWERETSKFKHNVIREQIDPLDFYVHELDKLLTRKSGWLDAGLCPFHDDNTPGSFHVDLNTGAFKCLSCEADGDDIIDFTMALYGLSFLKALEKLAQEWRYIIPLNMAQTWNKEGHYHATN